MINNKYSELMEKIRLAGHFVSELTNIEHSMNVELEDNNIDIKVKDILSKCIDDINKIYIDTGGYIDTDGERAKIKELQEQNSVLISIRNERGDKIKALEDKLEIQEDELIKAENELQQIKTDYNIGDE